ncbi:hypothetical protein NDA13_005713 [Ustilago tritici]|nr:hypothetical protein NDA13_005713 [Ustilago tritici]
MPQETLTFPPLYCLIGAYRLAHDPSLYKPMWTKCSKAAKQAIILSSLWAILSWPLQSLFVRYFMSASASVAGFGAVYSKLVETAGVTGDSLAFRIPVPSFQTFATFMFVMGQVDAIMQFCLRRKLRECRNTAYIQTVRSRGKAADWWSEYTEEFANPPIEKAIRDAKKQGCYLNLASPLVRFFILKVFLLPMQFLPFFGMALGAALRSLSYGRLLHQNFFQAKRMSPLQVQLWITERQSAYRSFGFVAALMERIPLIGLIFSVSNQIGAAMWAHDLEKRQQTFHSSSSAKSVELEEYKKKPSLNKLYKQVRHDQIPDDDDGDSGHGGNGGKGEHSSSPSHSLLPGGKRGGEGGGFKADGLAVLRRGVDERATAVFTCLSFTFPLKLISPLISARNASLDILNRTPLNLSPPSTRGSECKAPSVMYILGYGGGLVSGDSVDLDVDVGSGCSLLILTQGSTKVFKTRNSRPTQGVSTAALPRTSEQRAGEGVGGEMVTRQTSRFLIRKNATLVLLPDPVTCFASARYDQTQRFDLRDRNTSSLIMLDWITPGRTCVSPTRSASNAAKLNHLDAHTPSPSPYTNPAREMKNYSIPTRDPELWSFDLYRSRNQVRTCPPPQPVATDLLLLSQAPSTDSTQDAATGLKPTDLARRNHPYGCYATLMLAGPDAEGIVKRLTDEFDAIQQRPSTKVDPREVIWSLSHLQHEAIGADRGTVVVRIAASDSQTVRKWLSERLVSLETVLGTHLYRQALGS